MEENISPTTRSPATQPTLSSPGHPSKNKSPTLLLIAGLVLLLVVLVSVVALVTNHSSNKPNKTTAKSTTVPSTAMVEVSDTNFTPATITVKKGTVVQWTVKGSQKTHVVASNPYPKDDTTPGLKSKQIGNNVSYTYTFNKTGTYQYHDDLNPTVSGTVVVE